MCTKTWSMVMEAKTEMVTQSVKLSVEQQAAALIKGTIPYTREGYNSCVFYTRIFWRNCYNTYRQIIRLHFSVYTQLMIRFLYHYISFIELPVLTIEPKPFFTSLSIWVFLSTWVLKWPRKKSIYSSGQNFDKSKNFCIKSHIPKIKFSTQKSTLKVEKTAFFAYLVTT